MLAIHWSPVKNTKNILKNGISKSRNGLYCSPLTGHKNIDSWWVKAFNQKKYRKHRNQYNGFIFKIEKEDLPACFEHGYGHTAWDTFEMEIKDLKELELRYRERIIHKIGERKTKQNFFKSEEYEKISKKLLKKYPSNYESFNDPILYENAFSEWLESRSIDEFAPLNIFFLEAGRIETEKNPDIIMESLNDMSFMEDTFSDWQIILSKSINPDRIKKIISDRNEYGKVLHKNKKYNFSGDT